MNQPPPDQAPTGLAACRGGDPNSRPVPTLAACHWRRFLWSFFALCGLLLILWLFRAALLTSAANAWIVNDSPVQADAIVVLGGGLQYRPFAAAELYKRGLAPKVVLTDVRLAPTDELGLTEPELAVDRKILARAGVPDNAIVIVGHQVINTYQESVAVRDWARQTGAKRLIIATEIFHTRRARWLFHKVLRRELTALEMVAVPPREYQASNWWRHESGLIAFETEVLKFAYYLAKY